MSRRSRISVSPRACAMSWPWNHTLPAVGSSSRISVRPSVDLPQPDSPTSPSVWPGISSKLTPATARSAPTVRPNTPLRTG